MWFQLCRQSSLRIPEEPPFAPTLWTPLNTSTPKLTCDPVLWTQLETKPLLSNQREELTCATTWSPQLHLQISYDTHPNSWAQAYDFWHTTLQCIAALYLMPFLPSTSPKLIRCRVPRQPPGISAWLLISGGIAALHCWWVIIWRLRWRARRCWLAHHKRHRIALPCNLHCWWLLIWKRDDHEIRDDDLFGSWVALGDRFWLFIQTLNNAKKSFNSKENSKYSFKEFIHSIRKNYSK